MLRVAMVHGVPAAAQDGVADYVEHLVGALPAVDVHAIPVELTSLAEVRDRLRCLTPDVVHVQFAPSAYRFSPVPGWLPLVLDRRTPLVTTVHEYGWWSWPRWMPDRLWRLVERRGWWDRETGRLLPASAEVAVTNSTHAALVRERVTTPVEVIPLAPNVAGRSVAVGSTNGGPVLAFFGYVHPAKGVRYLIEAVAALRDRYPGVRLLVIGGFTSLALPDQEARRFKAELLALAERCQVADRVEFTGYLPPEQVSARLAEADVGVLPFTAGVTMKSGALLTLLSHGLPTVITSADVPDAELRDASQVCTVTDRRDPEALTTVIDSVLARPELRERLRTTGMRFAATRSWSRVAQAHRIWYARISAGQRPDG